MSETPQPDLRALILEREPGGCVTFVSGWMFIGVLTALANRLDAAWLRDWVGILSRYTVVAVVLAGLARSYARRSLRPLGLALPFAIIGVLLSERFYGRGTLETWLALGVIVPLFEFVDLSLRLLLSRRRKRDPVSA